MTHISADARKLADMKAMSQIGLAGAGAKTADAERASRRSAAQKPRMARFGSELISGFAFLNFGRSNRQALSSVGNRCVEIVRLIQYGRMKAVRTRMPDDVLDEIGISLSDIPECARSLIQENGN